MELNKNKLKVYEYTVYTISFILFLAFFGETLNYGRTFDDFAIVDRFTRSPGDAKLISSFLYAKFHFYPIYFLSHELDNFITFLFLFETHLGHGCYFYFEGKVHAVLLCTHAYGLQTVD